MCDLTDLRWLSNMNLKVDAIECEPESSAKTTITSPALLSELDSLGPSAFVSFCVSLSSHIFNIDFDV